MQFCMLNNTESLKVIGTVRYTRSPYLIINILPYNNISFGVADSKRADVQPVPPDLYKELQLLPTYEAKLIYLQLQPVVYVF